MAAHADLADRVRKELSAVPNVAERKMFGALAFLVDGKMCICADDNSLMCRIGPEKHADAVKAHGCSTVVMRGREYRGYVNVDASVLKNRSDLKRWVDLSLEFNQVAKPSKKKSGT